jgi:rSAM/selenodomain-associated transferase 1
VSHSLRAKPNEPWLIIMVKEPRPGRVKTRLGRDIGMLDAAHWYRRHTGQLFYTLVDHRWTNVAALTPLTANSQPSNAHMVIDQGRGDLGRRMMRMLRQAPPKSVLIGSDILDVTPARIAHAMGLLADHDSVLGPAPDGGFWLIGFRHPKRLSPNLLDGIRWSTPDAMEQTAKRLPGRLAYADTLRDVDTVDDLP